MIFATDLVAGLVYYAAAGKIVRGNFESCYLLPAQEAGAAACIAWLLNWKNEHFAAGGNHWKL